MTSLASHHSVVGYSEGPFSAEEVATFLEKMASIKDESEEKTKEDIVSEAGVARIASVWVFLVFVEYLVLRDFCSLFSAHLVTDHVLVRF